MDMQTKVLLNNNRMYLLTPDKKLAETIAEHERGNCSLSELEGNTSRVWKKEYLIHPLTLDAGIKHLCNMSAEGSDKNGYLMDKDTRNIAGYEHGVLYFPA